MKKSKIKSSTIRQVLHYVRNYKLLLFLSILFATITVALTLYIPIIVGQAIDLLANGQGNIDLDKVLFLLGNIAIIAVIIALTIFTAKNIQAYFKNSLISNLFFNKYQSLLNIFS